MLLSTPILFGILLVTVMSVVNLVLTEYSMYQTYLSYKDVSRKAALNDMVDKTYLGNHSIERTCARTTFSLAALVADFICPAFVYWMYQHGVGNRLSISVCLVFSLVAWGRVLFKLRKAPAAIDAVHKEIGDPTNLVLGDKRTLKNIAEAIDKEIPPVAGTYSWGQVMSRLVTNLPVIILVYVLIVYFVR
jgi:hypothetical protein